MEALVDTSTSCIRAALESEESLPAPDIVFIEEDLLALFSEAMAETVAFAHLAHDGENYFDWCPRWSEGALATAKELFGMGLDAHLMLAFLYEMPFALQLEEAPLHWLPPLLEDWFLLDTDVQLTAQLAGSGNTLLNVLVMDPRMDVDMLERWLEKSGPGSAQQFGNRPIQLLVERMVTGVGSADHGARPPKSLPCDVPEEEHYWRITVSMQAFELMLAYGFSPYYARALLAEEIREQTTTAADTLGSRKRKHQKKFQKKTHKKLGKLAMRTSSGSGTEARSTRSLEKTPPQSELHSALTTLHRRAQNQISCHQSPWDIVKNPWNAVVQWPQWETALLELLVDHLPEWATVVLCISLLSLLTAAVALMVFFLGQFMLPQLRAQCRGHEDL